MTDVAGRTFETQQLEIGEIFEGKYRIVEEIGRGGFGTVYLAHQEAMDRSVALKVLKTGLPEEEAAQAKERFLREVKVIASLRHPNTVTIHDFGETSEDVLYMVLEYIEGETLDDIMKTEGAQAPERALHFGMQIARSLAEAHRHGVVHRDLKPANIMITHLETEGDFVKVLDFGVARLVQNEQKDLTQSGMPDDEQQFVGTPRYMSPEQVRGGDIDGRSDVYCLGLLLYEMLVGEPAVQGDTPMALITQHINPEPLPLDQLRALPDDVADIVRKCTSKEKPNRYESAELLVQDLRRVTSLISKDSGAGAQSSMSESLPGASMSYEGEIVTDYQDQLSDIQKQRGQAPDPGGQSGEELSTEDWEPDLRDPSSREPGNQSRQQQTGPGGGQRTNDEFGDADPFSPTKPKSRHADDMPAPPEDDDAFVPEPDPAAQSQSSGRSGERTGQTPDESDPDLTLRFVIDTFKITFLSAAATFGVYMTFLVIGALLDGWIGGRSRVMAALVIALLFPVLSAISETSDRERFRVVRRRINRVARALVTTAGLTVASSALILMTVPGRVIGELRTNPNWFLHSTSTDSPVASANETFSLKFADLLAGVTGAVGVYNPSPGSSDSSPSPAPSRGSSEPPAPTRPSTSDDDSTGAASSEEGDRRQPRSAIELMNNPPDDKEDDSSDNSAGSDGKDDSSPTEQSDKYKKW